MDILKDYYKNKEKDPKSFLQHFRCTTEPIGGGVEYDEEGELVNYKVALDALQIQEKLIIEKACKWLKENADDYAHIGLVYAYIDEEDLCRDFKKAMEE